MIETYGLTKRFDQHTAVDRLTMQIEQGEVFGFLGPNGAGKTTTVRMLTSLIAPTSGTAKVLGYKVGDEDQAIRRRVGILTETPGLYDRLSAWRNLTIYARLYEVEDPAGQVEKYVCGVCAFALDEVGECPRCELQNAEAPRGWRKRRS